MKRIRLVLSLVAVIAALSLLSACKRKGAGQALPGPASQAAAPVVVQPQPKQLAAESLARALSAPADATGMRLASYCLPTGSSSGGDCFRNRVLTELLSDIGRRVRQGKGFLTVEAAPEALAAGQAGAQSGEGCGEQVNLLAFKLTPKDIFPKQPITPLFKSPCYAIGVQTKLTDCQCLNNIGKVLVEMSAQAKSRGQVLTILDVRRFGTWEDAATPPKAATVDAPGYDIVYAFIPKPKNFDAAPSLDFVKVRTAPEGGVRITANPGDAPPLRIELPDTGEAADAVAKSAAAQDAPPADAKTQVAPVTDAAAPQPGAAPAKGKEEKPAKTGRQAGSASKSKSASGSNESAE